MLVKLVDFIKSITLKDLIFVGIIVILFGCLCFSMNKCSTINDRYENNIKALTDTISYYESKTGSLIATKTAYESDIKELKLVNNDLYQEIADMKIKLKNVSSAANIKGEIIYEPGDTVYIVKSDTIYKGFEKHFDFSNEWRTLNGNITYKTDSLGIKFNEDKVKFDYTFVMDKNNKLFIKSDNPYVQINNINGFTIPKPAPKKWGLSVLIGYSYDIQHNTFGPTVSVGVSHDIIQW